MRYPRLALLSAVLLLAGTAHAAPPCEVAASVRVDCPQGNGVTFSGSGTVVAIENDRALVLTNRHVAEHAGPITVKHADGKSYSAVWLGTDATADLAALMIQAPACDPCPPAATEPAAGTVVVQVGYPHARPTPIKRVGRALANVARMATGARVVHAGIATEQGDSGSGCFCNGELVAVVWGGDGRSCSCVALEDVHRFCRLPMIAQRFPQLAAAVGKADAKPKLTDCPAGVKDCSCGCAAGKPCTCSQPQTRHPDYDGSGDMGYWQGDRLVARWFASTNTIRYYANGKYGPPVQCAAPQRPVYYNPPSFGGCPGGRCGSR